MERRLDSNGGFTLFIFPYLTWKKLSDFTSKGLGPTILGKIFGTK